jgi:hypothetical protein
MNLTGIADHQHGLRGVQTNRLDTCPDDKMAESTAISIMQFDSMDYRSWSMEAAIRLEQKQVLGIVDGTEEAQKDATELQT